MWPVSNGRESVLNHQKAKVISKHRGFE